MMLFTILFLSLIITVNTLLWRTYRRGLLREIRELNQRLEARDADIERAYCYIDELQKRNQRYQALLDHKTAIRVAPIPRDEMTWIIEYHLN